jgi:hypothetical protein
VIGSRLRTRPAPVGGGQLDIGSVMCGSLVGGSLVGGQVGASQVGASQVGASQLVDRRSAVAGRRGPDRRSEAAAIVALPCDDAIPRRGAVGRWMTCEGDR